MHLYEGAWFLWVTKFCVLCILFLFFSPLEILTFTAKFGLPCITLYSLTKWAHICKVNVPCLASRASLELLHHWCITCMVCTSQWWWWYIMFCICYGNTVSSEDRQAGESISLPGRSSYQSNKKKRRKINIYIYTHIYMYIYIAYNSKLRFLPFWTDVMLNDFSRYMCWTYFS